MDSESTHPCAEKQDLGVVGRGGFCPKEIFSENGMGKLGALDIFGKTRTGKQLVAKNRYMRLKMKEGDLAGLLGT